MTPSADVDLLAADSQAATCYFRSAASGEGRKALIQITERCNLHCAHCFVSATRKGSDLGALDIETLVAPRLQEARVKRITLTGGEPFAHPEIVEICEVLQAMGVSVGICTNGTCTSDSQIARLAELGNVHVNISFDGFTKQSHGKFRGNPDSFDSTVETTRRIAEADLLQGILSTPNALTGPSEYGALVDFATEIGATYLLMNPLSSFGRGILSKEKLQADRNLMLDIRGAVEEASQDRLEIVPIRFPNDQGDALAPCVAGEIIYVFVDGRVAVCPYLVFAASSPSSRYNPDHFILGNILETGIAATLDSYSIRDQLETSDPVCVSCELSSRCGKGCPAVVVGAGGKLGERDLEPCPV